ncbi:MAG: methyltransferase [Deltaproteobacteria bacterium]|nr:methyltransferase [Deltaproteobacteria bacterium]
MDPRQIILKHTRISSPPLCPEIRMHLITEACPLWRASDQDLEKLGLDEPFWGFAWAGGQALARYLLDHPELAKGRRVLDIGCGGGIEAIAAALCGAIEVEAWDVDPLAIEALRLNAALNHTLVRGRHGDPMQAPDTTSADLILAGDMSYDAAITNQIIDWLRAHHRSGAKILLADPKRGFFKGANDFSIIANLNAPSDVDVDGRYMRQTTIYGLGWTATAAAR